MRHFPFLPINVNGSEASMNALMNMTKSAAQDRTPLRHIALPHT
jgi:hypothetical protein